MEEVKISEKKRFSIVRRAESFAHAGRGIAVFLKSTHNAWVQVTAFILVVALAAFFHVTATEWMMLVFAGGFVLASEAFNTAIEIDIDLTSSEYHPYARDTKDVAAGAVLIATITAAIIGLIIFIPHITQTWLV